MGLMHHVISYGEFSETLDPLSVLKPSAALPLFAFLPAFLLADQDPFRLGADESLPQASPHHRHDALFKLRLGILLSPRGNLLFLEIGYGHGNPKRRLHQKNDPIPLLRVLFEIPEPFLLFPHENIHGSRLHLKDLFHGNQILPGGQESA